MLCKRDHIISDVKERNAKYLKHTHKFGIEVPNIVVEAIDLDEKNGDNLWKYAIPKEMKNVRSVFKILTQGGKHPPGYHKTLCHTIFDIKMDDFRRKAALVAGGHVTKPPANIMYASVVSRETV